MGAAFDIELFAGDTLELAVDVVDQDDVPVDLTGAVVDWQLSKSAKDTTPLIEKTSTNSNEISVSNFSFVVHIQSADTEDFKPATYYHEAQVTLADGTIGTAVTGKCKVKENLVMPRSFRPA